MLPGSLVRKEKIPVHGVWKWRSINSSPESEILLKNKNGFKYFERFASANLFFAIERSPFPHAAIILSPGSLNDDGFG